MSPRRRGPLLAVVVAVSLLAACGGGSSTSDDAESAGPVTEAAASEPDSSDSADATADPTGDTTGTSDSSEAVSGGDERPSEDITLTPETVVVDGNGGTTLKSVGGDGSTLTLDGSADGVADLEPGSVLLLTGVTVVKVIGVERDGDDVVLATESAAIGDVIADGELSWSDVSATAGAFHVWEPLAGDTQTTVDGEVVPSEGVGAGTTTSIDPSDITAGPGQSRGLMASVPFAAGGPGGGTVEADGYKFTYSVTHTEGGATKFHIDVAKTEGVKVNASIDATMSSVITEGRMQVERSVLNALELKSNTWEGKAKLTFEAGVGDDLGPVETTIEKLPISVDYPIIIYGIPFNLNVSAKLLIEPALTSKNSVMNGQAEVSFGGSVGLSYGGGSVGGKSDIKTDVPDPTKFIDGLGIGASAMVIAVQAPKISFGLGWASTNVGVFFDSVLSAGITVTPGTTIVACYRADVIYTASVGIDGKFLGQDVNIAKTPIHTTNWTFVRPDVPACTNA